MKTIQVSILFILLLSCRLSGQKEDSIKYISLAPYDFHLAFLKDDQALLIDVREFFEFNKSRLSNAVNIPSSGNLEFTADTIDKKYSLFLYCTTDFRSKRVAAKFCENGFRKVYSLDGGIVAWKKDGFPVERKRRRK